MRAYDESKRDVLGVVKIRVQVGPACELVEFVVLDIKCSFNLLLGRPWLHEAKAVASTYHQCLKFPYNGCVVKVSANVLPVKREERELAVSEQIPIILADPPDSPECSTPQSGPDSAVSILDIPLDQRADLKKAWKIRI